MPPIHKNPGIDSSSDDENKRIDIAVRALGDMRSRATATASSSTDGAPTPPSHSRNTEHDEEPQPQHSSCSEFVSRMSSLPLLGTAIRVYEHGKASSRVVKYGAEMVESSVKTISKPVIGRLPVNQLDEFACRQLDRFDRYRRPSIGAGPEPTSPRSPRSPTSPQSPTSPRSPLSPISAHISTSRRPSDTYDAGSSSSSPTNPTRGRQKLRTKTLDGSIAPGDDQRKRDGYGDTDYDVSMEQPYEGSDRSVPRWIQSTHSYARASGSATRSSLEDSRTDPADDDRLRSSRRSLSPDEQTSCQRNGHLNSRRSASGDPQQGQNSPQNTERQVVPRSRWQAMLLEAGGLGAALSEENMRRLKYCLQWLQYATAHIDAQILILRDFIESIQPIPHSNSNTPRRPPISEEQLRKLTEVRKDIVSTIRQMVDVVSKYAGGALPEPARGKVRGFILKLPQRWASRAAAAGATGSGPAGVVPSSVAVASGAGSERATVAAARSSTGVHRRGQGREKRAAIRERGTGSRATSPSPDAHGHTHTHSHSYSHPGSVTTTGNQQISHSTASAAAQRILTLAAESLDMMRNVTGVVKDSLDRADAWVNRLRIIGVQRGGQDSVDEDSLNAEFGPPNIGAQYESGQPESREEYHRKLKSHRRGESSSSGWGEDESYFSGSGPASPFTTATSLTLGSGYQSSSSYTAASSMPSTPTGATFASPSMSSARDYSSAAANAPSPATIPLASMHITSRYNTPKSAITRLPLEEDAFENINESDPTVPRQGGSARMEVDS